MTTLKNVVKPTSPRPLHFWSYINLRSVLFKKIVSQCEEKKIGGVNRKKTDERTLRRNLTTEPHDGASRRSLTTEPHDGT